MRASPFISLKNSFSDSTSLYSPWPLAAHCCRFCACARCRQLGHKHRRQGLRPGLLQVAARQRRRVATPAALCLCAARWKCCRHHTGTARADHGLHLLQPLLAQRLQVVLAHVLHGVQLAVHLVLHLPGCSEQVLLRVARSALPQALLARCMQQCTS